MAAPYPQINSHQQSTDHTLSLGGFLGGFNDNGLFTGFSLPNSANIQHASQHMTHPQIGHRTAASATSTTSRAIQESTSAPSTVTPRDFTLIFPNQPKRQEDARALISSSWFRDSEEEPEHDSIAKLKQQGSVVPRNFKPSRFDAFLELCDFDKFGTYKQYNCTWHEANVVCKFNNRKLALARTHIAGHFGYKPFACMGYCEIEDCQARFTSMARLGDHWARKDEPKLHCAACRRSITRQNMAHHQRNCSIKKYERMSANEREELPPAYKGRRGRYY